MRRLVLALTLALALAATGSRAAQQQSGGTNWAFVHTARVAADFTDGAAVTTLQTITGLQLTYPAGPLAQAYLVDCDLYFSQATAVADNFGVQFVTAPSSAQFGGFAFTNVTALASIAAPTITNTTATNVITFTPAVATVLYAHIGGTVEIAAGGLDTVMNIQVAQATAANVIVVKRGSTCRWSAMP